VRAVDLPLDASGPFYDNAQGKGLELTAKRRIDQVGRAGWRVHNFQCLGPAAPPRFFSGASDVNEATRSINRDGDDRSP
jgi:hypothetical protein